MRIANSNIKMYQNHYQKKEEKEEEFLEITGNSNVRNEKPSTEEQIKKIIDNSKAAAPHTNTETEDISLDPKDRLALKIAEQLLSQITGRREKIRICSAKDCQAVTAETNPAVSPVTGIDYRYSKVSTESEGLNFRAGGTVKTTDGKSIKIDLDLNLSRKYVETHNIEFKAGNAMKDPLVINFDGPSASLTDAKYQFDIDSDGIQDTISFVKQGSGFLGIDKNLNGVIDNGSELFGPATGSGFSELAQYDSDNNGWIDENDSVYNNLRIWTKDIEGNDYLHTLKEKDVGAIYLENLGVQFSFKDSANQLQGQLKNGGVYLSESGRPGFVSEVDLAV